MRLPFPCLLALLVVLETVFAFSFLGPPSTTTTTTTTTCLYGKGFRSAKNKQAAMAQKLELARKKNQKEDDPKAIERIVIFYKDGTFKNFEQS